MQAKRYSVEQIVAKLREAVPLHECVADAFSVVVMADLLGREFSGPHSSLLRPIFRCEPDPPRHGLSLTVGRNRNSLPDHRLHFSPPVDPVALSSRLVQLSLASSFFLIRLVHCLVRRSHFSRLASFCRRSLGPLLSSFALLPVADHPQAFLLKGVGGWSGILGFIEKGSRASVLPAQRAERATGRVAATVAAPGQPVCQLLRQTCRRLPDGA
jgi:hypothetical protein